MKSNIITIDNLGNGFDKAAEETKKVAAYMDLSHQDALRLQLYTEEMMSLARSVTGMKEASFWIETGAQTFKHHDKKAPQHTDDKQSSLIRSATSPKDKSLPIEAKANTFMLHLSTETVMDKEQRAMLLSAATTTKNEAAVSFLGRPRDAFESAMAAEPRHNNEDIPYEVMDDVVNRDIELDDPEWDQYERSTLKRLADNIEIAIRGKTVDMTVYKTFD